MELKFVLKPRGENPDFPVYKISYEATDPAGRKVSYKSLQTVTFPVELEIPTVRGIAIDGNLGDWKEVKPYELKSRGEICAGSANWKGQQDCSARIYLGHDHQRLYVCMDVTDDQIAIDDKHCYANDGVEFFWDGRPADKQDGKLGVGTGHVILPVPPVGRSPVPSWYMPDQSIPQGLVAAATRRPGGYTYEFSAPLEELGVKTPVAPGQRINLEFMVNDRDIRNGCPTTTHMTTSGQSGSGGTSDYARCTLQ